MQGTPLAAKQVTEQDLESIWEMAAAGASDKELAAAAAEFGLTPWPVFERVMDTVGYPLAAAREVYAASQKKRDRGYTRVPQVAIARAIAAVTKGTGETIAAIAREYDGVKEVSLTTRVRHLLEAQGMMTPAEVRHEALERDVDRVERYLADHPGVALKTASSALGLDYQRIAKIVSRRRLEALYGCLLEAMPPQSIADAKAEFKARRAAARAAGSSTTAAKIIDGWIGRGDKAALKFLGAPYRKACEAQGVDPESKARGFLLWVLTGAI